jgi:dihydrofolate reductase
VRELVYYVAATLDGFIAREDGSFDDFPWDDDFVASLRELYPETFPAPMRPTATRAENRRFDTVLMGRHTYEVGLRQGLTNPYPTLDQFVFSHTMRESPDPAVTLISDDGLPRVAEMKEQSGLAIWICGGSSLATALFSAGLIDSLVVKLNPIVFGAGIPLFGQPLPKGALLLDSSRAYGGGHVLLEYSVA